MCGSSSEYLEFMGGRIEGTACMDDTCAVVLDFYSFQNE